jgi:hypothetical protein
VGTLVDCVSVDVCVWGVTKNFDSHLVYFRLK